jgi:hypothetical protein
MDVDSCVRWHSSGDFDQFDLNQRQFRVQRLGTRLVHGAAVGRRLGDPDGARVGDSDSEVYCHWQCHTQAKVN